MNKELTLHEFLLTIFGKKNENMVELIDSGIIDEFTWVTKEFLKKQYKERISKKIYDNLKNKQGEG